jgi:hypothetical protein
MFEAFFDHTGRQDYQDAQNRKTCVHQTAARLCFGIAGAPNGIEGIFILER